MSRLRTLAIPFVTGQDDATDANILPDGTFVEVLNGRRPAQGSLRLRRGWRPVNMTDVHAGVGTLTATDLYSYDRSLLAAVTDTDGSARLATYANANTSAPWVLNRDGKLSPLTDVRPVGSVPDTGSAVFSASAAVTSDGLFGALLVRYASGLTAYRVFVFATDDTVAFGTLANGSRVRKLVSIGTKFAYVENTTTTLTLSTLDPAAVTPAWAAVGTLLTAAVTFFDVATARTTTPTALHVATIVGGLSAYRQFTFAGAQTGAAKTIAAANASAVTLDCNDVSCSVASQDLTSGDVTLLTFAATGAYTTSGGPTAVLSSIQNAKIAVAFDGSFVSTAGTHVTTGSPDRVDVDSRTTAHGSSAAAAHKLATLEAGAVIKTNLTGFGLVFDSNALVSDTISPWGVLDFGEATPGQANQLPFACGQSPSGDALLLWPQLPRDVRVVGVRAARVASNAHRPGVHFADAMYFVGGTLTQWAGGGYAESGMIAPLVTFVSSAAGATVGVGTYAHRAITTWFDERGRKHFSEVSLPTSTAVGGGGAGSLTFTVTVPKTQRRSPNLITNPTVELYRTEAGPGALFYLTATAVVDTTNDATTLVDSHGDSSLITQPRLYTEGETGATSGVLEISPAEPCSFAAATRQRLLLGGGAQQYQFSQITLPDEPVTFADPGQVGPAALVYFDTIDGRASGVAAQDDIGFIGSLTRLFVTGGEGPNLAGVGEFPSPAELPSDVGFFEARSIIETSEGLWFQGSAQYLYLAPRGSGSPKITQKVQRHLAGGVVGAGYDSADNAVAWALGDASAVVRLLEVGSWSSDALPFVPRALIGHQGQLWAVDSSGGVWTQPSTTFGDSTSGAVGYALRVTTGSIQPFGLDGWGRLAAVSVLGTFEAAAALLVELSYDEGVTWTALGTQTVGSGLSVGQTFQEQFYPANQRGGRFRARITMTPSVTTTEGCRLTGLTLYLTTKQGPARLDSAKRK